MYTLLVLTALAQPAIEPAAPSGRAPEQALAVIDAKGNLTLTHVAPACMAPGMGGPHTVTVPPKDGEKAPTQVKVKLNVLNVTVAELPAKHVEAYGMDGKPIAADKLAKLLEKERAVLIAMDGKKVDPFHLQLFKDDTIVLVPPANTLGGGGPVGAYGVPFGDGPPPIAVPPDRPPQPPEKLPPDKGRPDDGKKPDPDRKPDTDRKPREPR